MTDLSGMYDVIETALKNRYGKITVTKEPTSYLGMNITRNMNDRTLYLDMAFMTTEILEKYGDSDRYTSATPSTNNLFIHDN